MDVVPVTCRQVWLDRDTLKHARNLDQARQAEIAKLKQMRFYIVVLNEFFMYSKISISYIDSNF